MAQKTLDKYFSVSERSNYEICNYQQQCCNESGNSTSLMSTNVSTSKVASITVVSSDDEQERELSDEQPSEEEEVDEQMQLQEEEFVSETGVSNSSCECHCCTHLNVPHHPIDVSGSRVSLYYSISGRQKKA